MFNLKFKIEMADNKAADGNAEEDFVILKEDIQKSKHAYNHTRGGEYNLKAQTRYLIKLAHGYFNRYKTASTKNIFDILKAHTLFNGVGYRSEDGPAWAAKAFEVQEAYWDGAQADDFDYGKNVEVNEILSEELFNIRTNFATKLKELKPIVEKLLSTRESGNDTQSVLLEFCEKMASISLDCTNRMSKLCELLIKHSLSALKGPLPCDFSVVALGSIARGEATPYSDIEYIFLIKEKNEQTEKFFEKLAMTSYFFIGNLRETTLNTMAIAELEGWFEDKQKCGFHIDGITRKSGNIPTTNAIRTLNANILTPKELFTRYKTLLDEPNDASKRGDMTAMLHYTKSVFSSSSDAGCLLEQFMLQRQTITPNHRRQEMNKEMFAADANEYNFRPDDELIDNGYLVNVKKELYRYPSIMLHDISILADICKSSSWATLDGLKDKGVISSSIYQSLFFLLACACYIRLSAYLFHNSQDDRLSVLLRMKRSTTLIPPKLATSREVGKRWHLQQPLFVLHCEHSVPLKNHIGQCNNTEIMSLLQAEIEPPNWMDRFQTLHCCHAWIGAWSVFEREIGEKILSANPIQMIEIFRGQVNNDLQKLWFCIKALGYLLLQQRKYDEAYGLHKTFVQLFEEFKGSVSKEIEDIITADVLEELGTSSLYLNLHIRAKAEYTQSLEIRKRCFKNKSKLIAKSNLFIGKCLRLMKKYPESEKHLLQALQIYHNFDGKGNQRQSDDSELDFTKSPDELLLSLNNSSAMLGQVLWNLGNLHYSLKYYQRAFNYFSVTERMFEEAYGNEACHKDIAKGLLALAFSSDALQRQSESDQYFFNSTLVITQLFDPKRVIQLKLAEKLGASFFRRLIPTIFRNLPGYREAHYETAAMGQLFAIHLIHTGHHKIAENLIADVVEMYQSVVTCGENDEEHAKTISFLGLNAWKCKRFDVAKEHFSKALEMLSKNGGQFARLEEAETLQNMGLMYAELQKYQQARECLMQAKDKYLEGCHDANHPKVLKTDNQLNSLPGC